MHVFLSKSTRFESTDFESVMIDDVGCSRRHQCPQCGCCVSYLNFEIYQLVVLILHVSHLNFHRYQLTLLILSVLFKLP